MNPELVFSNVTFEYPGATEAMFEALSLRFSQGWTGIVGANGGGKTTLLHLAAGLLKPEIGTVRCVGHCDLCGQTDDEPPAAAEAFFSSYDTEAYRVREAFGVDEEMLERWDTLSFGERRRLTLAATVFEGPDILCLDEPTNHLDPEARDRLIKGLRLFTGIGLVVSHDRVLLDALCTQCLFVGNGTAILRPGRYDVGRAQAEREQTLALDTLTRSQDLLRKAKGELQRRRVALQNVEAQDTKRAVSKNDHDARNYINSKRNTDSTGGFAAAAGAQARRVSRLAKDIATMDRPESRKLGLAFPLAFRAKSNTLLTVPAQQLSLGGERQLTLPEIILCPEDRIALTGPNGAGKSSLLRLLLPKITLPAEQVLYLPQALDAKARAEMRETLDRLPREAFAHVMNVVATLGSEPGRVSAAADWSPGEARKLFLGLATLRPVALMILDEPTNHLDLPAVENLEEALNEAECALLVISHDAPFLKRVCPKRWELSLEGTFRAVDYSFNNE
ncbi:MAG: ATP-binding cassette domain-containing protein [Kiritimatiellia bacterium]